MPPSKLDPSVLLAIGLVSTGCGDKDTETTSQPCLGYPVETDTGPCLSPETDTGPCLMYETDTGPCLDFPADTGLDTGDAGDTGKAEGNQVTRAGAAERVLARGVLPGDVAKFLRKKQQK